MHMSARNYDVWLIEQGACSMRLICELLAHTMLHVRPDSIATLLEKELRDKKLSELITNNTKLHFFVSIYTGLPITLKFE